MNGTVNWFSARRGYGFINDEDVLDYFVYFSEITGEGFRKLKTGQKVLFEDGEDEKGRNTAKSVQEQEEAVGNSLIETRIGKDGAIITLSTCTSNKNIRLVVQGERVAVYE